LIYFEVHDMFVRIFLPVSIIMLAAAVGMLIIQLRRLGQQVAKPARADQGGDEVLWSRRGGISRRRFIPNAMMGAAALMLFEMMARNSTAEPTPPAKKRSSDSGTPSHSDAGDQSHSDAGDQSHSDAGDQSHSDAGDQSHSDAGDQSHSDAGDQSHSDAG
jgi:hypothetical protein